MSKTGTKEELDIESGNDETPLKPMASYIINWSTSEDQWKREENK